MGLQKTVLILAIVGCWSALLSIARIASREPPSVAENPVATARLQADRDAARRERRYQSVISGNLRFADGKPAGGYRVDARFAHPSSGAPGQGYAISDEQGNYTIRGLGNRTQFLVKVNSLNRSDSFSELTPVTLPSAKATVINVNLLVSREPIRFSSPREVRPEL